MKAKFTFLAIALVVLLCLPAAVLAQQRIDIPSNAVNGGERLVLDSAERLGITPAELQELSKVFSEGATIELLKPVDATAQPKDLVFSKVSWMRDANDSNIQTFLDSGETVRLQIHRDPGEPREVHVLTGIRSRPVQIVLYNTTKSRIDLRGWQLRITPGAIPDETDAAIDRMSNVDIDFSQNPGQDTKEIILPPNEFSMLRKIDYASVNDPGKTRMEQLRGIPDGIDAKSWGTSAAFEAEMVEIDSRFGGSDWMELRNTTDKPIDFKKWILLVHPEEDDRSVRPKGTLRLQKPAEPFIEDR